MPTFAADVNRATRNAISYYLRNAIGDPSSISRAQQYDHAVLLQAEKELLDAVGDLPADSPDSPPSFPRLLIGPRGLSYLAENQVEEDAARGLGYDYPPVLESPAAATPVETAPDPRAITDPATNLPVSSVPLTEEEEEVPDETDHTKTVKRKVLRRGSSHK